MSVAMSASPTATQALETLEGQIEQAVQRAQTYCFLSRAFLYPRQNWLEDLPLFVERIEGAATTDELELEGSDLAELQHLHRETFGLSGSLCYETEFGLPHEFRQSQELADISGFYQAFGFRMGGVVRERPDHIAAELEFMYLLALKQAYALQRDLPEQADICWDAQRKFLQEHLGRWVGPFCRSLEVSTSERLGSTALAGPYVRLARLTQAFLAAEAQRLGAAPEPLDPAKFKPTPFDPHTSCAGCAVAEKDPTQEGEWP